MATEKQMEFIEKLVDQLGYKNSPYKESFLKEYNVNSESKIDVQQASDKIEWLLKLNKLRRSRRTIFFDKEKYNTVSELSQFVFCPASYSIKKTCIWNKTDDLQKIKIDDDFENLETSLLLRKIEVIENFKLNESDKYKIESYNRQKNELSWFFSSIVAYNGYSDEKVLINHERKITGRPSLIFQCIEGYTTLVVEKMSYNLYKSNILWDSIKIQTLAYANLFNEFRIDKIFIVIWQNYNWNIDVLDRNFKIFEISNDKKSTDELLQFFSVFEQLNKNGSILFEAHSINPSKCFKCSYRTICNHKSGLINNLSIPYNV
jgi:CRISPR/Cas system-associated exonuclease Cas4 (RecB family)